MYFEVVFDVETKKLFRDTQSGDPAELGVSIVSVYYRQLDDSLNFLNDNMISYWEKDIPNMWKIFAKADRIIGFNSLNFDVRALAPYAPTEFATYKHFDILDIIRNTTGRRFSLNSLAKDTLGEEKIDIGTNAVIYWNKGDLESLNKLKKYCEADVIITRNLYDYGVKNKYLKYTDKWNNLKTIDVDFSYPKKQLKEDQQFSLF
jgi:hypothetical protein